MLHPEIDFAAAGTFALPLRLIARSDDFEKNLVGKSRHPAAEIGYEKCFKVRLMNSGPGNDPSETLCKPFREREQGERTVDDRRYDGQLFRFFGLVPIAGPRQNMCPNPVQPNIRHYRQTFDRRYDVKSSADPAPKKNSSICSTRNVCACGVHGCSRYSFSSIFCRSTHSPHACFETFL